MLLSLYSYRTSCLQPHFIHRRTWFLGVYLKLIMSPELEIHFIVSYHISSRCIFWIFACFDAKLFLHILSTCCCPSPIRTINAFLINLPDATLSWRKRMRVTMSSLNIKLFPLTCTAAALRRIQQAPQQGRIQLIAIFRRTVKAQRMDTTIWCMKDRRLTSAIAQLATRDLDGMEELTFYWLWLAIRSGLATSGSFLLYANKMEAVCR